VLTAVGVFFIFGACMACLAGAALLWSGTAFDRVWALNRRAYNELAPFGKVVAIPFLFLGLALAFAGFGWFKRRLWAWWLAVAIFATQVLGNALHIYLGRTLEGGIGLTIASGLLLYLSRTNVRAAFKRNGPRQ
jgi:hypothetical protein